MPVDNLASTWRPRACLRSSSLLSRFYHDVIIGRQRHHHLIACSCSCVCAIASAGRANPLRRQSAIVALVGSPLCRSACHSCCPTSKGINAGVMHKHPISQTRLVITWFFDTFEYWRVVGDLHRACQYLLLWPTPVTPSSFSGT